MNYEDIVNFLLARIAEDEAAAQVVTISIPAGYERCPCGREGFVDTDGGSGSCVSFEFDHVGSDTHIFRPGDDGFDQVIERLRVPADPRVLAECAAKRDIVLRCNEDVDAGGGYDDEAFLAQSVLLLLANIYCDHPDFNKKWKY